MLSSPPRVSLPFSSPVRRAALLACSVLTFGLSACGGSDADHPVSPVTYAQRCLLAPAAAQAFALPEPTGNQCIGKTAFHLVDASRPELNTPQESDQRELLLKVWYPMQPKAGGRRADYLAPDVFTYAVASGLLPEKGPGVAVNAVSDAEPQPGHHPVVLFSPGYGGNVEMYTSIIEDLASQGVIVVAIDHPFVSGIATLNSGELARAIKPDNPETTQALIAQASSTMVADQRFVLDWLQGRAGGQLGLLKEHLDLDRIAAYGHSIGGSTAVQTLRQDERLKSAIDIDGSVQGDTSMPWRKPVMLLLASNHGDDPTVQAVLSGAPGLAESVIVPNTGHMDFGDLKLILGHYQPDPISPVWTVVDQELGSADALTVLRTTNAHTLAFLRAHALQ